MSERKQLQRLLSQGWISRREFVKRMTARGYTERQVRRLVDWYMRVKQAG